MALDAQGKLAVVTVILYVPFLFLTGLLLRKYGVQRAWLLLLMFSIIRTVGGILLIAAETVQPTVIGLFIGGYALEASGLSPLLLGTLGFLTIASEHAFDGIKRVFNLLHLVGIGALVLTIIGIANATSSSSSSQSSANTMRRAGVLLFAALYIILIAVTLYFWSRANQLMKSRKSLLGAITFALPFLGVRTLYSVLSTFSSSSFGMLSSSTSTQTQSVNTSDLAKFNMFTGEWWIYLVMSILMETTNWAICATMSILCTANNHISSWARRFLLFIFAVTILSFVRNCTQPRTGDIRLAY
ncbi:hypothetical protein SERLA73DRAFT_176093, partial [Serpula lacrymans var. lacrymans S7.3]